MPKLAAATILAVIAALAGLPEAQAAHDCARGFHWDPVRGSCSRTAPKSPRGYRTALRQIERGKPAAAMPGLTMSCNADHGPSCTLLGFLYLHGRGVAHDAARSHKLFQAGCQAGDPEGCFGVASLQDRGVLGDRDDEAYLRALQHACNLDSGIGCYRLGDEYRTADDATMNQRADGTYQQAYRRMAEDCSDDPRSCWLAGVAHAYGRGTPKDPEAAIRLVTRGCDEGSGDACNRLGWEYVSGSLVAHDTGRAVDYLERSCQRYDHALACHALGSARAGILDLGLAADPAAAHRYAERACTLDQQNCDLLGLLYSTGKGGHTDDRKAGALYLTACQFGNGGACRAAGARELLDNTTPQGNQNALRLMERGCALGSAEACGHLGEAYADGTYGTKDLARAFSYSDRGCHKGDAYACFQIGRQFEQRDPPDHAAAMRHYTLGCEGDDATSCAQLAAMYGRGQGATADAGHRRELLRKSCDLGHGASCGTLGKELATDDAVGATLAFLDGCTQGDQNACYAASALLQRGNQADRNNAINLLTELCDARQQNYGACNALAHLYLRGEVVPKDTENALALLQRSCQAGDAVGCEQLGTMYMRGDGVTQDFAKAQELMRGGCDRGRAGSCLALGYTYYQQKNYELAATRFEHACNSGNADGCLMLGFVHYYAQGRSWDLTAAAKHYQKSCELGQQTACANLAELYDWGIAVPQDHTRALGLYQQSCTDQTHAGCGGLGYLYEQGKGTTADPNRAEQAYRLSCGSDLYDGCMRLARFLGTSNRGTAEQIAATWHKAFGLAQKDADSNPYGAYLLGEMHWEGRATVKDPKRAAELFVQACDQYEVRACMWAGYLYLGQQGVAADPPRAATYYDRACAAKLTDACKYAQQARGGASSATAQPASGQPTAPQPATAQPPVQVIQQPGPRGCGCQAASPKSGGSSTLLVLAAIAGAQLNRRRRRRIAATAG